MPFNPMKWFAKRGASQAAAYKAAAGARTTVFNSPRMAGARGAGEGFTFTDPTVMGPSAVGGGGGGALALRNNSAGALVRQGGLVRAGGGGAGMFASNLWGNQFARHMGIGALAGGAYGAMSDNTSVIGGALGGAALGAGVLGGRVAAGSMYRGATFNRAVMNAGMAFGAEARAGYHGITMAANRGMNAFNALRNR